MTLYEEARQLTSRLATVQEGDDRGEQDGSSQARSLRVGLSFGGHYRNGVEECSHCDGAGWGVRLDSHQVHSHANLSINAAWRGFVIGF
jgi:hypothetical protein